MQNRFVMALFGMIIPIFTRILTLFFPGRNSTTLTQECRNKVRIMTLVQGLKSYMAPDGSTPVQTIVEKCYALGDFPALWAVEGSGKDIAEWHMARNPNISRLLVDAPLAPEWQKAQLMLHAGIGMAFARYHIEKLKPEQTSKDQLRTAVSATVKLCKENSIPGYAGAALESIGLVSRFIHNAAFCRRIHEVMKESEPDSLGFFWRGCGRAIYFGPQNFMPGFDKPCRAIDMCDAEAPDEECRQGLLAGCSWAQTVVNMETPEVMEWVLANLKDYYGDNPGYPNGMTSSVVMRWDISPHFPLVESFRNHKPTDPKIAALWQKYPKAALDYAIDVVHPTLAANHRLDEVFHYQSLPNLIASLGGSQTARA